MALTISHKLKAAAWGLLFTAALAVLIVIGSRNLNHFDAALVGYTFATLFATFGITYRYAMWLQRPPTCLGIVPRHRRRDARVSAADDRSRRRLAAAVRPGHHGARAALRDQRHGLDAHRQLHLDERVRVRFPRDSSCDHRYRHAAVLTV